MQEVLFRGIIYQTLRKKFNNDFAIILQALFFTIWNIKSDKLIYYACLGIILGYIAYRTQSLWASLIINLMSGIPNFIERYVSLGPTNMLQTVIVLTAAVIAGSILVVLLIKSAPRPKQNLKMETEVNLE